MSNTTSYYCTSYCCYLGAGGGQAQQLTGFQNFGLPLSKQLQVFDRGCGDYSGTFNTGLETTDGLTVNGPTAFTYSANAFGVQNYGSAKTTTLGMDGVVVCEAN